MSALLSQGYMPYSPSYSTLHRDSSALIFIDLQAGHLHGLRTITAEQLTRNVVALTRIAIRNAIPVILTGAKQPPPGGAFLREVLELLPDQTVIARTTPNAWNTQEFVASVEATGRKQLILAGVALDIGVTLPALAAHGSGYNVTVVVDCTGATDPRVEAGVLLRLASAGIALTSWAAVGVELQQDLSTPAGRVLMELIGSSFSAEQNPFQDANGST